MFALGALGRKLSNHSLMISACFIAIIYNVVLSVSTNSWQIIVAQLLQAVFVAIVMGNGLSYFTELLPNSPGMSTTIYYNGSIIGRLVEEFGRWNHCSVCRASSCLCGMFNYCHGLIRYFVDDKTGKRD